jgi:regulator of sigma E protease
MIEFFFHNTFWFLVILTVLVFVHEFGHYLIARWNGVRVEVFSIGFGAELFGWRDRAGTRWKFSMIPLGGYVKMLGDSDPTSGLPISDLGNLSVAEQAGAFHTKRLGQRAAVVTAGPAANFLFAIVVLAALFMAYGRPLTPPEVGQVQADTAAARGGIRPGDVILRIDGQKISRFEDVQQAVRDKAGVPLKIVVERADRQLTLDVTPGERDHIGFLGISHRGVKYVKQDPGRAIAGAASETWHLTAATVQAMWQMVMGTRGTGELGGPLRIWQMSGQVAEAGWAAKIWFVAVLSINLGLINLFPVPVLDGGHLLFYAAEAVRGRPLAPRTQEYGFRIGLALVLTLMVFATWNDLVHLRIVEFVKGLVT